MARRRVRGPAHWRQLPLPGLEALLGADAQGAPLGAVAPPSPGPLGGGAGADGAWGDWEEDCFREGCRYACRLAAARLAACAAYTTQIGFQFGGTAGLATALQAAGPVERLREQGQAPLDGLRAA